MSKAISVPVLPTPALQRTPNNVLIVLTGRLCPIPAVDQDWGMISRVVRHDLLVEGQQRAAMFWNPMIGPGGEVELLDELWWV